MPEPPLGGSEGGPDGGDDSDRVDRAVITGLSIARLRSMANLPIVNGSVY